MLIVQITLTKPMGGGVKDYSTKEVKLNEKWVDGKPIYRKVFVRSDLTGFNTGLSIDTLVHQEVLVSQNISTSDWRPIPWLFNNGANYGIASWCGGYYLRDNGSIAFQVGSELSKVKKCIIIFEYTKK